MFDTIIVSGGSLQTDFALDFLEKEKTLAQKEKRKFRLIAADKGLEFFQAAGQLPDLVIGDFDSLSQKGRAYLDHLEKDTNTRIIRLNVEKDDSDTQSAVNHAIDLGARSIVILGATGSRFDHMLANLGLLLLGKEKGVRITILDPHNRITLIESGTILEREKQFGEYVSFFPVGGTVHGLSLEGFHYPLRNYDLQPSDSGLTVSNEIQEETATVTYTDGTLLMIMSRD